ncbi:histidine kinase [Bacillus sp. JJ1566]|uniref:cache domain-containing sensor histidine kinase n=1 Tax=Bacillus sp. JJ1566 TaxID=3122961 RepID=UPI003000156C
MKKIKFQNRFTTKVVISIMIVVFISSILNSFFYYIISSKVVKENVRESSLQIVKQAADSLSFIFTTGSDTSDLIYSNERLQNIVMSDLNDISIFQRDQNNNYVKQLLNSFIYNSSFVRIIYIIQEQGTSWGSGTFSPYKLSQYPLEQSNWVAESLNKNGVTVWEGLQYDRFSGAGENTELILPISRVMKDFHTLDNIAYLQVALDGRAILEKINEIKLGKTGRFFVVDDNGTIMIDSNLDNINKNIDNPELYESIQNENIIEFEFLHDDLDYYGVKQPLSNGWTIVGMVPIDEITGELVNVQTLTIFITILFTIIALTIGLIAARRVTNPIHLLTKQMKLVEEGNLKARTEVHTTDEIGLLSNQFNRMISQVEILLEQVKEEQNHKKEAELRAIKHRINPHFLFNTLSTIRWLVKFNQTERANTALSALIRLLEANMGKSGELITINNELDIVKKFMDILQIRYEQAFELQLKIDPEIEEFLVPQMLIQPIVENAVFHGIVPTGKEGLIQINGWKNHNVVIIEIINNGIVIQEETIKQIKQIKENEHSFVGIGLSHVIDSIHLYYAQDSTFDISSMKDGTKVTLTLIPKDEGGKHV